jgi:hypothetical protein
MQHSNSKAHLEPGGLPTLPPNILSLRPMGQVLHRLLCSPPVLGLLHSKLKEFLDLEQGNHSVFNYTRQFNTLTQYGSYHIEMDEKKVNLYRNGLTIQLQDHLVQYPNLSYNDLASDAINQERTMKVVIEVEEKKRKRMTHGSSISGSSNGGPPKYGMVYTPHGGQLGRPQQQ